MSFTPEQWEERIGLRIRLRDLHVFLAAAELGSMAKAAEALAISQPAISKSIADLEHALGVQLLERSPHGVQATIYGEALSRRSLATFDELRQGVAEIRFLASSVAGEVRVGCNESLTVSLLPKVIETFSLNHPAVRICVVPASRPISVEIRELRDRTLDVILGRGLFPEPDLQEEVLFHERLVVVAGFHSPWARRECVALSQITGEKWILHPPEEAPGSLVREAFERQGLALPVRTLLSRSFHLRQLLLTTGQYVTVIPDSMAHVFNVNGPVVKELPIDLEIPPRPVALFTLKNRTLNPVVGLFIQAVRDAVKTHLHKS